MNIETIIANIQKAIKAISEKVELLETVINQEKSETEVVEIYKAEEENINSVILFALKETPDKSLSYSLSDISITTKPYIGTKIKEYKAKNFNVVFKLFCDNSTNLKNKIFSTFGVSKLSGNISQPLEEVKTKIRTF